MSFNRRSLFATAIGATAALAFLYSSCLLPSEGPAGPGATDSAAGDTPLADAMTGDGLADALPEASTIDGSESGTGKPDSYWVDGEYCPDPRYPPRSDGCPCQPGSTLPCRPDQIGKVCDYYALCPPLGARYTCEWIKPDEKERYSGWVISPLPCPTDGG